MPGWHHDAAFVIDAVRGQANAVRKEREEVSERLRRWVLLLFCMGQKNETIKKYFLFYKNCFTSYGKSSIYISRFKC